MPINRTEVKHAVTLTEDNPAFDCVRCGMPTDGSATFGEKAYVCTDLDQCILNQRAIHKATTDWRPRTRLQFAPLRLTSGGE